MSRSGAKRSSLLDHGSALLVLCVCLYIFSTPLRAGGNLLPYAQDDFYYYLTAARNLVHGLGSTFDGRTLTNGYHPLYFLLLVLVSRCAETLRGVFWFLFCLDVCSGFATFVLVRRLMYRKLTSPLLANGLAGILFCLCVLMISEQMEVTLTLPLGFLFLWLLSSSRTSSEHFLLLGGVAAALVLSRLDAMLLVLLAGTVLLSNDDERLKAGWRGLTAFTVPFALPLLAYGAINLRVFHRIAPISGAAKQLRFHHGIPLVHVIATSAGKTRLMFLIGFVALLAVPLLWRRMAAWERAVAVAVTLFPFLHWAAVLSLSDWPLWGWYSYSLRFSLAFAFLLMGLFVEQLQHTKLRQAAMATIYVVGIAAVSVSRYRFDPEMALIAVDALHIRDFAATHPGRYAMGDRAGMVGYVNTQSFLQTEGLMEDDAFLHRIQRQDPLVTVLSDYGIDYYVGFTRDPLSACFHAAEPANAGPDSPVMRGEFCGTPAAAFTSNGETTAIYPVRR